MFGGGAWSRTPGDRQWYLHLFDRRQPDLNWEHPEVRAEFEDVLRFWLSFGVDGFRVDVAHGLVKAPGLPNWERQAAMVGGDGADGVNHGPMWDQDGVHDIYRNWHRILDQYAGQRMMVAEAWVRPQSRLACYVRSDEMQQAFNFDYLLALWDADALHEVIETSLAAMGAVGAPATWVMSNHDTVRHASRLGLSRPGARPKGIDAAGEQPDEALGLRRARAAILLTLALPGSAYLYQGEELGLPEHTTMAAHHRQDPAFHRTGGAEVGRDGSRVPLPWRAGAPSLGFGPGARAWLPQPDSFTRYAVDQQEGVPGSTLELYREVLRLRRIHRLGQGRLRWRESEPDVLAFDNGGVCVVVNLGLRDAAMPTGEVLVSSQPVETPGRLPGNTSAWITRAAGAQSSEPREFRPSGRPQAGGKRLPP